MATSSVQAALYEPCLHLSKEVRQGSYYEKATKSAYKEEEEEEWLRQTQTFTQ